MSCRSKKRDVGASSSLVLILEEFQTIYSVPGNLTAELLDDGQGVELTLKERKASWHKSCRSAFDNERLVRAKKRRHESGQANESEISLAAENTASPIKARRSSLPTKPPCSYCIFCDSSESAENLHAASTLEIDREVRGCASLVNDSKLIVKLASRDMTFIEAKYHTKCLVALYSTIRK